jgi:hypothetical protein
MGYFAPPSHETWRMVSARSHERGVRIDWMPPDALATTWHVLVTSVIWLRTRTDPPDLNEAMEAGLLPPWADGEWTIDARLTISGNAFFVCRGTESHAYPDFTAVLRMRIDDDLLVGMICRVRPPCSKEEAKGALGQGRAEELEQRDEVLPRTRFPAASQFGGNEAAQLACRAVRGGPKQRLQLPCQQPPLVRAGIAAEGSSSVTHGAVDLGEVLVEIATHECRQRRECFTAQRRSRFGRRVAPPPQSFCHRRDSG